MEDKNQSKGESYESKHVWDCLDEAARQDVMEFCERYREFLNAARTEREAVDTIIARAEIGGFTPLTEQSRLVPGSRVYSAKHGKVMAMAVIGSEPLEKGLNVIGSHIDAPRLDLKPRPLYQEAGLALFKTHYYGGIKKYQWVSIPLSLHGVVFTKEGNAVRIAIGNNERDPVFTIADLLPHLAKDQMEKKMSEAVKGEALNVLVGGNPVENREAKERLKQAVLDQLNARYGLIEEDFISAELEAAPAFPARDVGFDRSMIGGYGQDDRVCAYTSLQAILELDSVSRTAVVLFADKEEIGSVGNTGMESVFLTNFIAELAGCSLPQYSELTVRRILANSRALSADVTAGTNPSYPEVMDKHNEMLLGYGTAFHKYGGGGGKRSSSDANAEFVSFVRQLFNKEGVVWQTGELGKVDQGGGGTIAYLLAHYGMDVLDCGVPLLGMHSPFEVAHKGDIYMTYKGYKVFFKS